MITNIIHTDMSKHFDLLKQFNKKIMKKKQQNQDSSFLFLLLLFPLKAMDIKLLTGLILHQQDFNANTKQFKVARIWSEKVNIEFRNQFTLETEIGIT